MACASIMFSTLVALLFTASLWMFGDPSVLQLALGYVVTGQVVFWATILCLSGALHGAPAEPAQTL